MFSYASVIQALLAFGMETTFFRYINKYPEKRIQTYNNGFWIIFLVSLVFALTAFPFAGTLAGLIKFGNDFSQREFARYIRYFVVILVVDAWCVIPFAKLRADGRPMRYSVIKLINVITTVFFNVLFIFVLPYWVRHHYYGSSLISEWFISGWVGYVFLSNLFASIVTLLILLPELMVVRLKLDNAMLRGMLVYSGPILIANLSYAFSTRHSEWGQNHFFLAMPKIRMRGRLMPV
jgi:Na+-driven multidrug efflux pump